MREAEVSAAPRIAGALLLTLLLALSCSFRCDAQGVLPPREFDALSQIAAKLKIPTALWDFSLNPCDPRGNWARTIRCDCNASTKVCQVVAISLSAQNLAGELPKEFGNLTSLTEIDLSRNYIIGSIPAADWASLPLRSISLGVNRLPGPIPDAIGKISTLQYLYLDNNMLQGPLPPSLGNLTNLSTLLLNNNMLEGPLPQNLGNLTNLSTLYLGDNWLSGRIPDVIGKISKLQNLYLANNRLSGPIPDAIGKISMLQNLYLGGNQLSGPIPDAIGKISTLLYLALDNNMLQGPLPRSLGNLTNLSRLYLGTNQLSGPIPDAIGKISTLLYLFLDNNMLQGSLPPSLGNLTNLSGLFLYANYFTGELPETLGNLKNLSDFRIDGNDISGKIPSFIGNWTKLQRFDMQGTSLEGPFPANFSTLQGMTELRVSDLKKTDGSFPPLQDMLNMRYLILRNCSISGQIPGYIGKMTGLKRLDLSFNNLTGAIPINFEDLTPMNIMYLTSNALSGTIPSWILRSKEKLDISYNNFTVSTSESVPNNCRQGDQNFIASFSSSRDDSVATCLRKDLPCSQKARNYKFFINCGGAKVTVNNVEYEEDTLSQGTSTYFFSDSGKWAYSSTGFFVGNNKAKYIAQNTSMLTMPNPELYTTARLNPLSLKYFGLCMQKGNYTVKLHFAEIMFTDDQKFSSIGRRVFDVSIQGRKVLKDFNIAQAANGTGKEIIMNFTTFVEDSTLEIHFQWAGKGTNAIPYRGVYGSLISAISVTPNFKPDLGEKKKLSVGAIVGIVAASCAVVILVSIFLWFHLRRRDVENSGTTGPDTVFGDSGEPPSGGAYRA